jgi:hypothetical protein
MKLKNCTPEFQKIYWKNKIVTKFDKKDIDALIRERNRRNLENKTEVDFILEDLVSSKIVTGVNDNQRNKLEEYYAQNNKNKHSKHNIIRMLTQNNNENLIDVLNNELTNENSSPKKRKNTDQSEVNEIVVRDIMRSPRRKTIKTIKTVKFEKFITSVENKDNLIFKFDEQTLTTTQPSTQIQIESAEKKPSPRDDKIFKAQNVVDKLEKYEKLMNKIKEQAMRKVEEYDRKRTYLKNKYKMVCEAYFPYNL